MSHPDPLFDPDNAYEDDDMMIEDENYDDYADFHYGEIDAEGLEDNWDDSVDDSMDGDAESAFGSCGWGVDEYYEHYESGDDY